LLKALIIIESFIVIKSFNHQLTNQFSMNTLKLRLHHDSNH
jgi:hypothetical protein